MHYRTEEVAPRALDGAPLWRREPNLSREARPPLEEELPTRCMAHFTHRAGARVVELVRGRSPRHRVLVRVLEEAGARRRLHGLSPRLQGVAAWLRASRVEVVHVHDGASALVAVPAALRVGCRVVLDRSAPLPSRDRTQRAALRWLSRRVDRVVVETEAARRRLVRDEGLDAECIAVIPPSFDFEAFATALRAGPWCPLPSPGGPRALVARALSAARRAARLEALYREV